MSSRNNPNVSDWTNILVLLLQIEIYVNPLSCTCKSFWTSQHERCYYLFYLLVMVNENTYRHNRNQLSEKMVIYETIFYDKMQLHAIYNLEVKKQLQDKSHQSCTTECRWTFKLMNIQTHKKEIWFNLQTLYCLWQKYSIT